MTHQARSALVLQGGGALGAYELGAARALYEDGHFNPDIIAGVSIGAITAVLLARPARGLKPLEALEAFWEKVTVPGMMLLPALRQYASLFGNRNFLVPRLDYLATCLGCSVVRKFNGAGLNAPPVEIRPSCEQSPAVGWPWSNAVGRESPAALAELAIIPW